MIMIGKIFNTIPCRLGIHDFNKKIIGLIDPRRKCTRCPQTMTVLNEYSHTQKSDEPMGYSKLSQHMANEIGHRMAEKCERHAEIAEEYYSNKLKGHQLDVGLLKLEIENGKRLLASCEKALISRDEQLVMLQGRSTRLLEENAEFKATNKQLLNEMIEYMDTGSSSLETYWAMIKKLQGIT